MRARTHTVTIVFYVVFALWFTANRYGGSGFYSGLIAPIVAVALVVVTFALFCVIVLLAARRAFSEKSLPWADAIIFGCSIVAFDLFWRFYLSPHAWDAFKLTNFVVDAATPAVAFLGICAVVGEWKRNQRLVA